LSYAARALQILPNFVNTPLRYAIHRAITIEPSRAVWLAGRFNRISRRSSGIKHNNRFILLFAPATGLDSGTMSSKGLRDIRKNLLKFFLESMTSVSARAEIRAFGASGSRYLLRAEKRLSAISF